MRRNYRSNQYEYEPASRPPRNTPRPTNGTSGVKGGGWFNYTKIAVIASVFIVGVVVGIALNFSSNSNPASIETRFQIDQQAPNPELCQQFGASAIVTNMRLYVTLNPFSVFVTQPVMQPGCVLRQNNWSILEQQKLVSDNQVRDCKRRMNTFAFTGNLEGSPNINCVYQNDAAGNLFLNKPGTTGPRPESDNF